MLLPLAVILRVIRQADGYVSAHRWPLLGLLSLSLFVCAFWMAVRERRKRRTARGFDLTPPPSKLSLYREVDGPFVGKQARELQPRVETFSVPKLVQPRRQLEVSVDSSPN